MEATIISFLNRIFFFVEIKGGLLYLSPKRVKKKSWYNLTTSGSFFYEKENYNQQMLILQYTLQ